MPTYSSNFSRWSDLEALLTAVHAFEQGPEMAALQAELDRLQQTIEPESQDDWQFTAASSTAATGVYLDGVTRIQLYGTGFDTDNGIITRQVVTSPLLTVTQYGAMRLSDGGGSLTAYDLVAGSVTEHAVVRGQIDAIALTMSSITGTLPTTVGLVTMAATGSLVMDNDPNVDNPISMWNAGTYATLTIADAAGHRFSLSGLGFSLTENPADFASLDYVQVLHRMLAGNDLISGSSGAEELRGFAGDDTYLLSQSGDAAVENPGEGTDLVKVTITTTGAYTLGANLENANLTNIVAFDLTGNELGNLLVGNAQRNSLTGLAGNDSLDGGAGADTMAGGPGDDSYVVDNIGDSVVEMADEGIDTVKTSISYSLADTDLSGTNGGNVEHLSLTGSLAINGTGNALANEINGNAAANRLDGASGADTLTGGAGNDTYVIDDLGDVIVETGPATDLDSVASSIGYTLGSNLENLTLAGSADAAVGNARNNILVGNDLDNLLDGQAGSDTLKGGRGNDSYWVDLIKSGSIAVLQDTVVENTDGNIDSLILRAAGDLGLATTTTLTLASTLEVLDAAATGSNKLNLVGNAADNGLIGNAFGNLLDGGGGVDTLSGGAGNDSYVVDRDGEVVVENPDQGIDSVKITITTAGNTYVLPANVENALVASLVGFHLRGNDLPNNLTGNGQANELTGAGGNDSLDGGGSADRLEGGSGDDTYSIDNIGDRVVENAGEGLDLVRSAISFSLTSAGANVEQLVLTGSLGIGGTGDGLDNLLVGNSGSNILSGLDGNDRLDGGGGADNLLGGSGDDSYGVDNAGDRITESADEGIDWVFSTVSLTLAANVERLTLSGTAAINATGNGLANLIAGNDGNNLIIGGGSDDQLLGGAGNDTYAIASLADYSVDEAIDDSAGSDELRIAATTAGALILNAATFGLERVVIGTGTAAAAVSTATTAIAIDASALSAGISLIGNAGSNALTGSAFADSLVGGAGGDILSGGGGDDSYGVDHAQDQVEEGTAAGSDTVAASISYTLPANIEKLLLAGSLVIHGTGNELDNILIGNGAGNTLTGNAGHDRLDGGAGADRLLGGVGDDTYVVDSAVDSVSEDAAAGSDSVESAISYSLLDTDGSGSLGGNVENLTLTGKTAISATGNALANRLVGNEANNLITGGGGADTLAGGAGNDIYLLASLGDYAAGESIDDSAGSDELRLAASTAGLLVLGAASRGLERVVIGTGTAATAVATGTAAIGIDAAALPQGIGLVGNAGRNALTGSAFADSLVGGAGGDSLVGGAGDDSYSVDHGEDTVVEDAEGGFDTVTSLLSYALPAAVEKLVLGGTSAIQGTGNELDNILVGNGAGNTLNGNAGHDRLDGGGGADRLSGGSGDDTYVVDSAGDIVGEDADAGSDTIESAISYNLMDTDGSGSLGGNVENLTLTGRTASNGTGNGFANRIVGNDAANLLDGRAGADTLVGGAGNDSYVVDDAGDLIVENGPATDLDLVQSALGHTLADSLENLALTGNGDFEGIGNAKANVITGNTGANGLDGLAGADTLRGGRGNDSYQVDLIRTGSGATAKATLEDAVVENAGEGSDLLVLRCADDLALAAPTTLVIPANVENLDASATGSNRLNLTGNGANNVLFGNQANNVIDGSGGIDLVCYGQGSGSYIVTPGSAAGSYVVTGPEGTDTLKNVEAIQFAGAAPAPLASLVARQPASAPAYAIAALDGYGPAGGAWQHSGPAPLVLRYSFMIRAPYYAKPNESATFQPLTLAQQEATRQALAVYASLLNIQFEEVADSTAVVDLRFGSDQQTSAGYSYMPGARFWNPTPSGNWGSSDTADGDIWLNKTFVDPDSANATIAYNSGLEPGQQMFATLIHEIGHALGLKHPFEDLPTLASAGHGTEDSDKYSIMSYTRRSDGRVVEVSGSPTSGYSYLPYAWEPETPMLYDIATLQGIYGANGSASAGDDSYSVPNDRPYFATLWDAGGTDTLDASNFATASSIDLNGGHYSSIGHVNFQDNGTWTSQIPAWYRQTMPTYAGNNVAIAYGAVIENAIGGSGADTLIGNETSNVLDGGDGNDKLYGRLGNDLLTGGEGSDSFCFDTAADTAGNFDRITDFVAAIDKFQLSNSGFFGLAAGPLPAAAFSAGSDLATATTSAQRILFDTVSGILRFDADGNGAICAPIAFAEVTPGIGLTATDFLVVSQ